MNEQLMEAVVAPGNVAVALEAVVRNQGAPGIDGMTTKELGPHLQRHWPRIQAKLLQGTYMPSPVRRKEIPKPGGGTRRLGIPTVLDRFVQQLLLQVMTPIWDPTFSEHSYGFRPGRSAHDAVRGSREYARQGHDWVVDMDIARFFDHVNHDILMTQIGKRIRDKRVLKLIGRMLRRGAMIDGVVVSSEEGTPQGGPLSPLLANIYLDALDRELEKRGHKFCRYADDCNIYVASQAAAERVLASIRTWIEQHLRLQINQDKSGVGRTWERKFLGFRITRKRKVEAAPSTIKRLKMKVRERWNAQQSLSSEELRDAWNRYLIGWWGYFQLTEERRSIFDIEGWIRRHIRKCFWLRWHNATGRRNALRRLGIGSRLLKVVYSSRGAWRIAGTGTLHTALSNAVLRRYGFLMPSDLACGS